MCSSRAYSSVPNLLLVHMRCSVLLPCAALTCHLWLLELSLVLYLPTHTTLPLLDKCLFHLHRCDWAGLCRENLPSSLPPKRIYSPCMHDCGYPAIRPLSARSGIFTLILVSMHVGPKTSPSWQACCPNPSRPGSPSKKSSGLWVYILWMSHWPSYVMCSV